MEDFEQAKPENEEIEEPIPFDDTDSPKPSISHSPLDLGGGNAALPATAVDTNLFQHATALLRLRGALPDAMR